MNSKLQEKYERLLEIFKELGSVGVAFSGGVDSSLLLYSANEALGNKALGNKALAITVMTSSFPKSEALDAAKFLFKYNLQHLDIGMDQLSVKGFAENDEERCYYCKRAIFAAIKSTAELHNCRYVVDGANIDDEKDYRPGMRATEELGIVSPLRLAGLTKDEIRELSKDLGLFTWNKPSYACLASRVPYGERITDKKLHMIEAAEASLMQMGLLELRVRCHDKLARIEVPQEQFLQVMEPVMRQNIIAAVKAAGFLYVALDLEGFRSGSLNASLEREF